MTKNDCGCARSFPTLWTVTARLLCPQDFPRQEYWSGLPFPPPRDPLTPGWNPRLLCLSHCRQIRYITEQPGKAKMTMEHKQEECFNISQQIKHLSCIIKEILKRNGKGHLKRKKQPRIKGLKFVCKQETKYCKREELKVNQKYGLGSAPQNVTSPI